ncbi:MAG: lysophospholipid acyltransferase family protein [Marinoscillum sp.]
MARSMWAPGILWICGIRMRVTGGQQLSKQDSYVFVANHQSYLDIPVLFRAITVNLYFVAKKELKKIPFLGWYMMATGMIFIDRTNRAKSVESLKRAAKLIAKGKSVIMFPEGTRSKDGFLADFKKGPFMLASQAGVDVVPVGISEPNGSFRVNKFRKTIIEVSIGDAIPQSYGNVSDIIQKTHDEVSILANRKKQSTNP